MLSSKDPVEIKMFNIPVDSSHFYGVETADSTSGLYSLEVCFTAVNVSLT